MAYGTFGSYQNVKRALRSGDCELAVNHFRSIQLVRSVQKGRGLARFLYCLRFVLPTIVSVVMAFTATPSPLWPVSALVVLAVTYFFDVQDVLVLIGLVLVAIGVTAHQNLLVLIGAPILVAFFCGLVWWANITRIVGNEVTDDKAKFREMWDAGLVLLVTKDEIHSVTGVTKRKRSAKEVEQFKKEQEGQEDQEV